MPCPLGVHRDQSVSVRDRGGFMIHVLVYIVLILIAWTLWMQNRDIRRLEDLTELQDKQLKKIWIQLINTSNNGVITAKTLDKILDEPKGKHVGVDRTYVE